GVRKIDEGAHWYGQHVRRESLVLLENREMRGNWRRRGRPLKRRERKHHARIVAAISHRRITRIAQLHAASHRRRAQREDAKTDKPARGHSGLPAVARIPDM